MNNLFNDFSAFVGYAVDMVGFALVSLSTSLILIVILTKIKTIQNIVFPFFDELLAIAKRWKIGKQRPQDGYLAIAFAIYSAGIAFSIFYLISQMATPL